MLGDKWTMLVVRELLGGPKRTMELLNSLFPISSRTLVGRLRDMEKDRLVERTDFGGNPPYEKMKQVASICFKHWLQQSNVLFIIGGKSNNTDIFETFRAMADASAEYERAG